MLIASALSPEVIDPVVSRPSTFGPGLIGDIADFIYQSAPYPNETLSLAGAFGFFAGICGRSYTFNGGGLNLYVLALAPTGMGKEAISDGISKMMMPLTKQFEAAKSFRGPGEIRSDAGLFKWFDRLGDNPNMFCTVGEFGLAMKGMASGKAPPHIIALKRIFLDIYGKSELGSEFDPAAYSDSDKVTKRLTRPTLTLIGDSTPETFYSSLDESLVKEGLLPRFVIFETKAARPRLNRDRVFFPSPVLADRLSAVMAKVLAHADGKTTCEVQATDDANRMLAAFEEEVWHRYNGLTNEVERHLWSRVYLNVAKLASLIAIGCDYERPIIQAGQFEWARDTLLRQVAMLIAKFDRGETGEEADSEVRQLNEMIRVVRDYYMRGFEHFAKYSVKPEMHRDRVFTQSYLSQRLLNLPTFRGPRGAATAAIKRALQNLLDADDVREVGASDKAAKYQTTARCFIASNPNRFLGEPP